MAGTTSARVSSRASRTPPLPGRSHHVVPNDATGAGDRGSPAIACTSSCTSDASPTCLRDFYTAAQLATLSLPGLPRHRHKIAELATRQAWPHREREGRGGGREFPVAALPPAARGELVRRHLAATQAAAPTGAGTVDVAAGLDDGATQRLAAKLELLKRYDAFRGDRPHRAALQPFADLYNARAIEAPSWLYDVIARTSARTIRRAIEARDAGRHADLGGRFAGRASAFDSDAMLGELVAALLTARPHLDSGHLRDLLRAQYQAGEIPTLPGLRSIQRHVARWRARQRAALLSIANPDKFRSVGKPALGRADQGIERINQLWEIDASPSDVLCADGRHSIYVVIDVRTRRMLALVTKTPRTVAALLLLHRAILLWGVAEALKTDNGSDFVSKHMLDVLKRLGIRHHELPPYSPEKKPFVERGIGTIQRGFMELMPGYIGHDVADRQALRARKSFAARLGEDDADAFCVELPAAELQARLDLWLANVYATRDHGTLGMAPATRAEIDAAVHAPKRIADEAALSWLMMVPASGDGTRVVAKKGISVGGREYWCDAFIVGETVHVRLDPHDLGTLWCYTGDPWRFLGRATNPELAGLSRATVAAQAKAAQAEAISAMRADLRRVRRKIDTDAVIDTMLHARDSEAGRVVALPRAAQTHTTDDLAAAAIARATGLGTERPVVEPTPQRRAEHDAFIVDFERARAQRDQSRDEAPLDRFGRWLAVDLVIRAGRTVTEDERHWHGSYQRDPEWSAMRLLHSEIEPASKAGEEGL